MSVADLLRKKRELLEQTNRDEGRRYLEEFCKRENVVVLPSGVAYKIVKEGIGRKACLTDSIEFHYHGTNIKGEIFDSSIDRGKPVVLNLNKLIRAYQEVVPYIAMGTSFIMVTPPEYAYRDEYVSKLVGPYSTLVFEIELLEIK
ncbi:FKBP-type peptidyl-prolyl cis-trans isomerase [Myroides sp. M-43]|uniref:FKBP-type peptidyl-prolyl cis-trans isomerase n=1 Tax=Myroides oncorhynchi TaxID=2893756 RepID=UPI001E48D25B|nr:FKBP-type peptidyl-prolyl cis-trans isomerase [Myroides oncorhynchi]MCC9042833.1 FKBP-type peptidyl-prolyl cis-trans isomerase [Myroides oncorhynchi]